MIPDLQIEKPVELNQRVNVSAFKRSTKALFGIAVLGQWLFVYYIIAFYGAIAWSGDYEKINDQLPHGIIEGDTVGNIMLGIHLFLAAIITFGGPLQFFTPIRKRFPVFHRWNGRIYYVTAFIISTAGLYMVFTRGAHGGIPALMGNVLNASLIMVFSVMAWRTAIQRNFSAHKKWALRAFLMVSGVWFFRIGYGLWLLLTGFSAPGMNSHMTGPYDVFLIFGHSLVPLMIIEYYFYVKASTNPKTVKIATILFSILSVLLISGISMVAIVFWFPMI